MSRGIGSQRFDAVRYSLPVIMARFGLLSADVSMPKIIVIMTTCQNLPTYLSFMEGKQHYQRKNLC